ncbi:hypothetical protein [Candidatus Ichthyocystis sparus]|uniref:hypothetical protein n=1 Tax=Candidatus Ichthyocystis sparus TaxID=1561004 RepID=UPI000B84CA21|nr:hypothetical protein [Candidatus Ichthyocystis sparus]
MVLPESFALQEIEPPLSSEIAPPPYSVLPTYDYDLSSFLSFNINNRGCRTSSCFFIRVVSAVVNSILFFLFGRLIPHFYTALDGCSLVFTLCNLGALLICFPLGFSSIVISGNDGISSLFRSALERAMPVRGGSAANYNSLSRPNVTYTLYEVRGKRLLLRLRI